MKHTKGLMNRKINEKALDTYVILTGIGGYEQVLTSTNADIDTLFDIASCGKILHTTPLLLQAVGEKKLALQSTLDMFFDHVPPEKKDITIFQLLTHTSGILRIPLPKNICAQGVNGIAAHIMAAPLAFAPGSGYAYSCNGMNLLGYIVEKLYGKTMDILFEERIKKPLAMTRSCFNLDINEPNRAICYTRKEMGPLPFDDQNVLNIGRVGGAGGSFFSPADILKYVKAVFSKNEKLYKKEFFDLAEANYTPYYAEGRGLGYLTVDENYPQTGDLFPVGSFGHCGHTGQSIFISRELQLYVIILTNATRFSAMKHDYKTEDYEAVMALRKELHNTIKQDLREQGSI